MGNKLVKNLPVDLFTFHHLFFHFGEVLNSEQLRIWIVRYR